eukprot:COSAG02_NODE_195_length_29750_cov_79.793329_7_plen_127_part_00
MVTNCYGSCQCKPGQNDELSVHVARASSRMPVPMEVARRYLARAADDCCGKGVAEALDRHLCIKICPSVESLCGLRAIPVRALSLNLFPLLDGMVNNIDSIIIGHYAIFFALQARCASTTSCIDYK